MIAFLKGKVAYKALDSLVLDVNGVGYEVFCALNALDHFRENQELSFYTYSHIREDTFAIYGFQTLNEKELFLSLLKVNGIGPKLAIKILSHTTIDNFLTMISSSDVSALSKIPKVGKKTAEQIILSLKGKLEFVNEAPKTTASLTEIVSALVNLGFREADCQKVVQSLPQDIEFEEGVRQGLASLTSL